ncbi:MAG: ankyrin repeat domain-containing protein [Alphaproteobacteria bacterium]
MYCKYDEPTMIKAVFEAVDTGEIENLRFYIMDGADPDLRNASGKTLLHHAAQKGGLAAAQMLLNAGADPNATVGVTRQTPLHYATNADMLALLATEGANVNAGDHFNWTPLHMAADRGLPDAVDALLLAGADPALTDTQGRKPADIARQKFETLKQPEYGIVCRRLGMAENILNADSIRKARVDSDLEALRAKRPQKRLGPGR